MKNYNKLIFVSLTTFIMFSCYSPKEIYLDDYHQIDTVSKKEIREVSEEKSITYTDSTLNSRIKTILCYKKNEELSLPIINLNSNEEILVSFDDFDADIKDYYDFYK